MKKIPSINASSLFHFTPKISSLKLILKNGVRFSYALEEYSKTIISNFCDEKCSGENIGVAIPMICFCDTPITRVYQHMDKYGEYMIGFDKKYLMSRCGNTLNPISYIQSPNLVNSIEDISTIYAETCKEHELLVQKGNQDEPTQNRIISLGLRKFNLRLLIGLCKSISFYDEREWRIFNDDNKGQINEWKWGLSKDEFDRIKKDINKSLFSDYDSYITLYENDICDGITHLVVKKESQVPSLVDYIMKSKRLFGYEGVSDKVKMNLVSKITSVKRITNDY